MQISKKQLIVSYVLGPLLQRQQFEKGWCAQQLLSSTSINRDLASLQTSLVLYKMESFIKRTSEQLVSAAWGRWWEEGKEELLGDPGFTTAQQIRQGRMCMCSTHSPTVVAPHWGITWNLPWQQIKGGACGSCWGDHMDHTKHWESSWDMGGWISCSTVSTSNYISAGISSLFLAFESFPLLPVMSKGVFCFSLVFVGQQDTCYSIASFCPALHPEWRKHKNWDIYNPTVWYFGSLLPWFNMPIRPQCL